MAQNRGINPNFAYYDFSAGKTAAPAEAENTGDEAAEFSAEQTEKPAPENEGTFPPPSGTTPEEHKAAVTTARRSMCRLGWGIFVLEAAWIAVSSLLAVAVGYAAEAGLLSESVFDSWQYGLLLNTVPLYAVAVPLYYLVIAKVNPSRPTGKKPGAKAAFAFLLFAVTMMVVGGIVGDGLMSWLSSLVGYDYANMLYEIAEYPLLINLLLTVVAAPLMEELIFRKLFLERLLPFGELPAMLIAGICFGLWHGNLYQFFYAALLGILLSYVYLRTGRLRDTIHLHAAVNFLFGFLPTVLQNWFDVAAFSLLSTEEEQLNYIATHILAYAALTVYSFAEYGAAIAGIVLLLIYRKEFTCNKPMLPELDRREYARSFINAGTVFAVLLLAGLFVLNLLPEFA